MNPVNPVTVNPGGGMNMKQMLSIGIGVVLGIIIVFLAFTMLQSVFTRAADVKPQDVVVSEIAQNSAKVTWTTGQEVQSVIEYGTSPTALNFFAPEGQKIKQHSVDLTLLSENTTYYLDVRVGDQKYDNGGIPWTFTTKSKAGTTGAVPTVQVAPTTAVQPSPTVAVTTSAGCTYTSCIDIKTNLGKGCTTQDYIKCLRKLTPTPKL